jgi:polar amino acid transport system substrate-binding protein
MEVDSTYLVAANSPIHSVADADRPGVRIAAADKGAQDVYLSGVLRQAQIVRVAPPASTACELFVAGKADAFAANREALLSCAERVPGSRVLEDRYLVVAQAVTALKRRTELLAYVHAFVEEAKASGLVRASIERAGVRGVQVAPPAVR